MLTITITKQITMDHGQWTSIHGAYLKRYISLLPALLNMHPPKFIRELKKYPVPYTLPEVSTETEEP